MGAVLSVRSVDEWHSAGQIHVAGTRRVGRGPLRRAALVHVGDGDGALGCSTPVILLGRADRESTGTQDRGVAERFGAGGWLRASTNSPVITSRRRRRANPSFLIDACHAAGRACKQDEIKDKRGATVPAGGGPDKSRFDG